MYLAQMPSEFDNYTSIEDYLLSKSSTNSETPLVEGVHCRDWAGKLNTEGYGYTCMINGKRWKAHRLSCLTFNGDFTEDKPMTCHKCNRKCCIEPKHLYAGSDLDNQRDMINDHLARLGPAAKLIWARVRSRG